jgi:hypothetical protein
MSRDADSLTSNGAPCVTQISHNKAPANSETRILFIEIPPPTLTLRAVPYALLISGMPGEVKPTRCSFAVRRSLSAETEAAARRLRSFKIFSARVRRRRISGRRLGADIKVSLVNRSVTSGCATGFGAGSCPILNYRLQSAESEVHILEGLPETLPGEDWGPWIDNWLGLPLFHPGPVSYVHHQPEGRMKSRSQRSAADLAQEHPRTGETQPDDK